MMNRSLLVVAALLSTGILLSACRGSGSSTAPGGSEAPDPSDVVLARYDGATITLDEYETRYLSSNGVSRPEARADSMDAYRDFLERYVNFRLKVNAAQAAGLDTLDAIQAEVAQYRDQMARPQLLEDEVVRPVARALYERQQTQIKVRHILLRVDPDAPPSDTLQTYRRLQSIRDSIQAGADFGDLAESLSQDPSAQQSGRRGYRGDLGYLTAGQLVQPFEERMYRLPEGEISNVFRTRFGYHILQVQDKRPKPNPLRISHLLIRPDGPAASDSAAARRFADSLRTIVVQDTARFDSLARAHSDDPQSASRGGDLGTVQPGQPLPDAFRAALEAIDTEGGVSEVVLTRFGYHLIQLNERVEPPSFEAAYDDLKRQVSRLPRLDERRAEFARTVRTEQGTTIDTMVVLTALDGAGPDSLARRLLPLAGRDSVAARTFATLGDSTFTLQQLSRYVVRTDGGPQQTIAAALDGFLNEKALAYAAARLEARSPEFARQMREYREGLLLFRYMQDSVWTVAAQDTAALRETYRSNRTDYRFPERVRAILLRAASDTLLTPYLDARDDGASLSEIVASAQTDSLVQVDTTQVPEDAPEPLSTLWNVGDGTAQGPLGLDGDRVLAIRDTRLPARTQTFAEARSAVVRDTQDAYEAEVEAQLRDRYNATVFPARLRYAFQSMADGEMSQHAQDGSGGDGSSTAGAMR